uniref:Uncharacterized protein n=1 Tax=Curvibacter symbiont subsp. Hydra magnipapillata TaxID=667019 RepID=C9YFG2_CURXX|nr:hypothetical protein Csp_D33180 [Curvibacter putative symbiont of Hydra magnipapillata]
MKAAFASNVGDSVRCLEQNSSDRKVKRLERDVSPKEFASKSS